jgi:hypothetical protein
MTQWKRYQERRRRKQHALQLLALSGAIRSADAEPCYLGRDRTVGPPFAKGTAADHAERNVPSIWHLDLGELLKNLRKIRSGDASNGRGKGR